MLFFLRQLVIPEDVFQEGRIIRDGSVDPGVDQLGHDLLVVDRPRDNEHIVLVSPLDVGIKWFVRRPRFIPMLRHKGGEIRGYRVGANRRSCGDRIATDRFVLDTG